MLKTIIPFGDVAASATNAPLSDIADGVLDVVARLLNPRLAVVSRIESTTYTVMAVVDQHHTVRPGQIYNLHDTFCVHMLETGQPLCISDTAHAPLALRAVPHTLELNVCSYIGVPLYMADGRVFGSLWAADSRARPFGAQDVALLQLQARLLLHEIDLDAQTRHFERLEQVMTTQTSIDPLTGLLDRHSFELALGKETVRCAHHRSVHTVAVLNMHGAGLDTARSAPRQGDALRKGLAEIVMHTSRLVDCCARIGDHTFAVLFGDTTADNAQIWCARVEAAIEAWNRVHAANDLALKVTVGIADCQAAQPNSSVLELAQQRAHEGYTSAHT